jgi:hypothetical protein
MTTRSPSRIDIELTFNTLRELADNLASKALEIPPHQRDFCWSERKSQLFINTITDGLPIPSILIRDDRNAPAPFLEDGRQRITTMCRFFADEILTLDGKKFSELSALTKRQIESYKVSIVKYRNATTEQVIEIFDRFQNGLPLSVGERFHSLAEISPIIRFAKEQLLTAGSGLHDELLPIFGTRSGADKRYNNLKNAVGIMIGLAFGANAITTKWDILRENKYLSRELTDNQKADMIAQICKIRKIFQDVNAEEESTTKTTKNNQWAVGKILGYIIWSFQAYPNDERRLMEGWTEFLVDARRDPTLLTNRLHGDDGAARFYDGKRWKLGYLNVFDPEEAQRVRAGISQEEDEVEDDEESM